MLRVELEINEFIVGKTKTVTNEKFTYM